MVCSQCGAPIEDNAKFCSHCGNKFSIENKGLEKEVVEKNTEAKEDDYQIKKHYGKDDISIKVDKGEVIPVRRKEIAILIAVLGGIFGFHRLYLGEIVKFLMFIGDWIIFIIFIGKINTHLNFFAIVIFLVLFVAPFVFAIRDIVNYIKMDKTTWCVKYGCRQKF